MQNRWTEWKHDPNAPLHQDRWPLQRLVRYENSASIAHEGSGARTEGHGIAINMSDEGLCLLMDWAPAVGDILRLQMPRPDAATPTPTSAEVRWVRPLPVGQEDLHLVGLKLMV